MKVVVTFLPSWGEDEQKPAVKIDVVDTGIGIKEEALAHLFEPFVQADASTSRKYGGTGLGLTITRHIVEMLGGELLAQSTLGSGSVFSLTIPTGPLEGVKMFELQDSSATTEPLKKTATKSERTATPLENKALEAKRILLAEDGPDNQRLISTVLRKAGAVVDLAENGVIAVERAIAGDYDLVLMDMQMPEMDGYQATEKLRSEGFSVPIVAIAPLSVARGKL